MKIIKCKTTYAIEMSKKQFLRWDSLSKDHDLIKMIINGFDSVLDVDWDLMYGGGCNLFITLEDDKELPLVVDKVKFLLKNL